MRTFSALWQAYQADPAPTWSYAYQCVIDGQVYTDAEISTFSKAGGLIANDFSLGNFPSIGFSISVIQKTGVTVSKNAKVEPYVRIVGGSGNTDWYRLGVFFIDNRKKLSGGKMQFECYDRALFLDIPFLQDGEQLDDYPMQMDTAMARIYTKLGAALDSRCTISHTMVIEYPNDMTMRQVAAMIAGAHGGNFIMTDEDFLRLVIPGYSTLVAAIDGSNAVKTYAGNDPVTYDSVAMIYTEDGAYYEAGTGDNELEITNYWATQPMCDAVQAAINGYAYTPYHAQEADLDPSVELGDYITIDGINCNLWAWSWNNRLYCDIDVPASSDTTTSEFGYTGTLQQAVAKKVTLGSAYYGASISRADGIKIARSDGASEAQFNSDVFAMRALVEGVMKDKIYFDPVKGTYVFDGELSADVVNALSALITPNLYAGKATISELTVDQLDTSTKVQNYLNEDTSDVNYIKIYNQYIEFITASTDGSTAEQVTNRDGQPLYWMDDTHATAATEETDYPVMVYTYTEMVKMRFAFEFSDSAYNPKVQLGAGDGVLPDSAKGEIFKGASGIEINYNVSNTGDQVQLALTDDKEIKAQGNTGTGLGVRNFAFGTTAPESPQFGDFWVNTGG